MAKARAVATADQSNIPATVQSPYSREDIGGNETEARDRILPRLTIAQPISPQVQEHKAEYIQDAKPGDFLDLSANQVFKDKLELIVCHVSKRWIEWPKERGKKQIIKDWGRDEPKHLQSDGKGRYLTDAGVVMGTLTFYVLNMTAGGRRAFIPLSSTALKAGRQWYTMITSEVFAGDQAPNFHRHWFATTTHQSNDQGDWFGWKFVPGPKTIIEIDPSLKLLEEARRFKEDCKQGLVQVDLSQEEHSEENLAEASM